MESMDEICSSEDEFDLMIFRSINNILNEHKEDTDQDNRSEESDEVFGTKRKKIRNNRKRK